MKKLSKKILLAGIFFLLTPICINLYANDSSGAILPTGDVQLRKTNGIIMEVESLYMKPATDSYLQSIIEVNYIFKNITDKDIVTDVFFPLMKTRVRNSDMSYEHDFNFKLYVNGKEKEYNKHSEGGVYFYWKQTFPANKRIHIKHIYTAHGYSSAGGLLYMLNQETDNRVEVSKEYRKQEKNQDHSHASGLFEYILTTANNWNKPIRSFNLLIEGFSGSDVCFEGKLYPSPDRYYAKNIINFSPSSELFFIFNQSLICEKEEKQDVKLYFVNDDTDIRETPNGKKSSEKVYGMIEVMIVKSSGKWRKIARHYSNDSGVLGWTLAEDLFDPKPVDWEATEEFNRNIKFSDAKLYKIDGPANIRDNPNGKKIGEIKNGEYVWVIESARDWNKIVLNNLRGWIHKQNLIDIWNEDN